MKIRLVQQMSGYRGDGTTWPPVGTEFDVPDSEGADLCHAGIAVPVAVAEAVETADAPPSPRTETRGSLTLPPAGARLGSLAGEVSSGGRIPAEAAPSADRPPPAPPHTVKRGPGRPPGSVNKPKP